MRRSSRLKPRTLAQASRIPGVSPADVSVLVVYARARTPAREHPSSRLVSKPIIASSCRRSPAGWGRERADIHVLHLLTKFGLLVHEHANRLSLISRGDRSSLFTRHVLDSLNPVSLFDRPPASALDVGSGAGFPGILLAVVWPSSTVTLLERREEKAGFLERAVRELGLKNTRVVPSRLEDLATAGSYSHARPNPAGAGVRLGIDSGAGLRSRRSWARSVRSVRQVRAGSTSWEPAPRRMRSCRRCARSD